MKILYFASLKEAIDCASEELSINQGTTVAELRKQLVERYGAKHFPDNILCAVNQKMADGTTLLNETDEVAFYPPVTGG